MRVFLNRSWVLALLATTGLSTALQAQTIEEIVVVGVRGDQDPTEIAPDAKALLATPGDINDPLKALLSLPGVTFAGGDMEEPIIRGAGPRDNLYLIDNIPVNNVFHELSDSIVSPNVIRTFDLYAGAMPAGYSQATGGVIDIGLRDPGDDREFRLDLSQLKSGIMFETPLGDRASAYVSYRHNLAHLFLTEFETSDGPLTYQMPESRDYTGKVVWHLDQGQIAFTALGAWDKTEDKLNPNAGAGVVGERIERSVNAQGLTYQGVMAGGDLSVTLSHSYDRDETRYTNASYNTNNARTLAMRSVYSHDYGDHAFNIGLNYTHKKVELDFKGEAGYCDYMDLRCAILQSAQPVKMNDTFKTLEVFASDVITVSPRLTATLGVHAERDFFLGQNFIEPRASLNYALSDHVTTYIQAGRYHQRPSENALVMMGALGPKQEAQTSNHFVLGQRWDISDIWRLQTDLYYKTFDVKDLTGIPIGDKITGDARGVDVLLVRAVDEGLSGWLALSYGKSERKLASTGQTYDYRYAPAFSATLSMNYSFGNGWRIGTKYRAQSGDSYTPIIGVEIVDGYPRGRYGAYHSAHTDMYQRWDVRLEKQSSYSFADVSYYVDVLNVLDRQNVSKRSYPDFLFTPDGQGGFIAHPDEDTGIPRFIAFGVNLTF